MQLCRRVGDGGCRDEARYYCSDGGVQARGSPSYMPHQGDTSWLAGKELYQGQGIFHSRGTREKSIAMEVDEAGASGEHAPPQSSWRVRKGGYRATMFLFVMSGLDSVGFVANMVGLVIYFIVVLHFDLAEASTTLTNFMGATFLISLLGGFISDTYMTRLNTVLVFGIFEILGYGLLTVQAHKSSLRPPATCFTCPLKDGNLRLFETTLCLLAVGFGGTRGALPALGADQFDKSNPKEARQLTSYFNWLLLSVTVGASIGVTFIVWLSTEKNRWALAFFICMVLAIAGFICLAAGKPFYRVRVPGDSPMLKLIQVVIVSIRNRKLPLPDNADELYEMDEKDHSKIKHEEVLDHTSQLRFFDKAAVLAAGTNPEPWKVCPVTQVEELKIIIRMLPILASTVVMNTCLAQLQTFSVAQGRIMDLSLGHSFKVPPASIPVIPLVFMSFLLPLYNMLFVPFVRRFTGRPSGISHLQRVGIGLVLSAVSMAIAAVVEVKRRNAFVHHNEQISLFWLSFQYGIFGIADMFTLVGLMEFFYSEAPTGMRSLSTSLSYLSLSLGYFLNTVLVHAINAVTARLARSHRGWIEGTDLNIINLDLFYWFLSILSCLNFGVYLLCATWYKYRRDYKINGTDDQLKQLQQSHNDPDDQLKQLQQSQNDPDDQPRT
ncbi:hypothetical protein ZIOFF_015452 [Zingiber officinale]|uniref:Uncharacterized protein n=1 Tax=Zingiber officinale TaxID=94328 RepID=A0A8J5LWC4_ZINOF|nr:hypothetical protein ZIOFF_015452 [Zingiber officinale]